MPKNWVIYNIQNVYVGPAPATGYHFINATGVQNNQAESSSNFNLVQPLTRVNSFSYNINTEYYQYRGLGRLGTLDTKIIEQPIVNFSLSYLQNGFGNEAKLGFYVNHPKYDLDFNGNPRYSNNTGVFLLSGFLPGAPKKDNTNFGWPLTYRDRRNFFLSIVRTGVDDLNSINFKPNNIDVIGFGNCYITNYSTQAAVGSFPSCSVGYTAENMQYYTNGSGQLIPALHAKSGTNVQGVNFTIPSYTRNKNNTTVLLPGDLRLSIRAIPSYTGVSATVGTGFANGAETNDVKSLHQDFNNLSIQSYNINLPLPREPLQSLNYRLPLDRKIVFPVFADIEFSLLTNEIVTGSLVDLVRNNYDYNIEIKNNNPLGKLETGTAIQYNAIRAKYVGSSFDGSIGSPNTINLRYQVELTPENYTRGLFFSGLLNSEVIGTGLDFLQEENGDILLEENSDSLIAGDFKFYY